MGLLDPSESDGTISSTVHLRYLLLCGTCSGHELFPSSLKLTTHHDNLLDLLRHHHLLLPVHPVEQRVEIHLVLLDLDTPHRNVQLGPLDHLLPFPLNILRRRTRILLPLQRDHNMLHNPLDRRRRARPLLPQPSLLRASYYALRPCTSERRGVPKRFRRGGTRVAPARDGANRFRDRKSVV